MLDLDFGFSTTDIESVRQSVEGVLGIEMALHDSLYWGEYYLWKGRQSEELRLLHNEDPLDGEPFERDHRDLRILVYATLSSESYDPFYQALTSIPNAQLIRQQVE